MSTNLSSEDRQIIRHLRYYPSTQVELQDVFMEDSKTMRSRIVRFTRNGLIFSKLQKMPKTRLPKNLHAGLSHERLVYFAYPNPALDHYSKVELSRLFEQFIATVNGLSEDNLPEVNVYLLGLIDTMLNPLYTRYALDSQRMKEVDDE